LAFANAIKSRAFEENKIASVLSAVDSAFANGLSNDPNAVSALFVKLCDLATKNNMPPNELEKNLKSKYDEYYILAQQVEKEKVKLSQIQEKTKSEFEKYNITRKELDDYSNSKKDFQDAELNFDKREEVLNVLYNIADMDKDPKRIVGELKKTRFVDILRAESLDECSKIMEILRYSKEELNRTKSTMSLYASAAEIINSLLQKGNSPENIVKIFDIYSRYPNLPMDQFAYDCYTYGGLIGAIYKKYLDFLRLNSGKIDIPL